MLAAVTEVQPVEPKVKGAAVREFTRWYVAAYGTQAIERVYPHLRPDWQRQITLGDPALGILASTWYAAPLIHRILDASTAGVRGDERTVLIRDGAHAAIRATLSGVYRLLFQAMMSPERYARDAQQLFSRYFNTGVMSKTPIEVDARPGHLSVIRDWTSHHPTLCELITFTAEYVYGALGCQELRIKRTACVSNGARECTFVITWRK